MISLEKYLEIFQCVRPSHADDILASAAKGIAEIITVSGYVNVDFKDIKKRL